MKHVVNRKLFVLTVPGMLKRNLLQHCLHMPGVHLIHGPTPVKRNLLSVFLNQTVLPKRLADLLQLTYTWDRADTLSDFKIKIIFEMYFPGLEMLVNDFYHLPFHWKRSYRRKKSSSSQRGITLGSILVQQAKSIVSIITYWYLQHYYL